MLNCVICINVDVNRLFQLDEFLVYNNEGLFTLFLHNYKNTLQNQNFKRKPTYSNLVHARHRRRKNISPWLGFLEAVIFLFRLMTCWCLCNVYMHVYVWFWHWSCLQWNRPRIVTVVTVYRVQFCFVPVPLYNLEKITWWDHISLYLLKVVFASLRLKY